MEKSMNKTKEMILKNVDDDFTVTACVNGYLLNISGKDERSDYHCVKYLINTLDELLDFIREINELFEVRRINGKA
jgi:hypothetical protein